MIWSAASLLPEGLLLCLSPVFHHCRGARTWLPSRLANAAMDPSALYRLRPASSPSSISERSLSRSTQTSKILKMVAIPLCPPWKLNWGSSQQMQPTRETKSRLSKRGTLISPALSLDFRPNAHSPRSSSGVLLAR